MSLLSPQLQAFLAVAQVGTVHGAADSLNLTQTGVTQRLRSLESQLKTSLFLRSRKGMQLTTEGEALLRYCQNAIALEGEALSKIQRNEESISVTIAGPTSLMSSRVAELCLPLYSLWPHLHLHLRIDDHADRLQLLRSSASTFSIVPPATVPNEMESKLLKPERYYLVASAKWKHRRLADILENERLIDFEQDDQTSHNYLKKFSLKAERDRLYVNNNEALIKYFSHGIGFGTLNSEIAAPYLERGTLLALNSGHTYEEAHALVWYPRAHAPAYFQAVIKAIK